MPCQSVISGRDCLKIFSKTLIPKEHIRYFFRVFMKAEQWNVRLKKMFNGNQKLQHKFYPQRTRLIFFFKYTFYAGRPVECNVKNVQQ